MKHLDEEQVQRLLHRELAPPVEVLIREHLAGCVDCRGRVAAAERDEDEVHALLRHLDHAPPATDAETIAAHARARDVGWVRWAAGIVLALGLAGAAYAAPGSPLRAWVEAVVEWMGGGSGDAPPPAGIAVAPGPALVILFTSRQAEGQAEVSLTDGAEVVVRAPGGTATFTAEVERLVIDNPSSTATFEILIPRTAPRVEILVTGVRVFLKEGPRVTGPFRLPLTPCHKAECSLVP